MSLSLGHYRHQLYNQEPVYRQQETVALTMQSKWNAQSLYGVEEKGQERRIQYQTRKHICAPRIVQHFTQFPNSAECSGFSIRYGPMHGRGLFGQVQGADNTSMHTHSDTQTDCPLYAVTPRASDTHTPVPAVHSMSTASPVYISTGLHTHTNKQPQQPA